ncbi:MAG: class I SAM-dependent methyltransferase [candidate division KSB1 bacterium]|nr:class I SAM-dependent methyltransferase [candidate division KSB1 bacterium]MDZ7333679.1 class I SAM-dependent methyltransferase [candidate division KSB1 bacterium]MDZ7356127.1 class I SAM-dependent methyltransferase [candidate division KSB1 bacterium]MDZ7398895.1 class I SAM-dependent methyltransferase [candidate division KSB1 bacterium]
MDHKPIAAGGSSFDKIDSVRFFNAIKLRPGMVFLDVACGYGYYALAAFDYVGSQGRVYAVDLWQEGLIELASQIKHRKIATVLPVLANATQCIPLKTSCADICLLATVLHDFVAEKTDDRVLKEIERILKQGGRFAVIEFEKVESHPGPPLSIRLAPNTVTEIVSRYGFQWQMTEPIGLVHYLSIFINTKADR